MSSSYELVIILVSGPTSLSSKSLWLPAPQCCLFTSPPPVFLGSTFLLQKGLFHVEKDTVKFGFEITSSKQ